MPRLKLNTLPPAQQKTFEQLTFTREHFVLYGGTAVALLAGHRISMDFDFFGSSPVTEKDKQDILRETSATGKLTNKIKTVLETAVMNYREANTPLSIENPLLSAPGFEPALITRQNTSNTTESNRSPGG